MRYFFFPPNAVDILVPAFSLRFFFCERIRDAVINENRKTIGKREMGKYLAAGLRYWYVRPVQGGAFSWCWVPIIQTGISEEGR